MMKILHITQRYYPAFGGSEIYMKVISEYFAKNNDVTVWTSDAYDIESFWDLSKKRVEKKYEEINGVKVRRFSVAPFLLKNFWIHKFFRVISWRVPEWNMRNFASFPYVFGMVWEVMTNRKFDFDIVHVTAAPYFILFWIALKIARKSKAKLILSPFVHLGRGEDDPIHKIYFKPFSAIYYSLADAILIQTNSERDAIIKFCSENGYMVDKRRFFKLGMGIFPENISGGDGKRFRKRYGIKNDIVFYIGPRSPQKGVMNLVEASKILWDKGKDFTLVLAGGPTDIFKEYYSNLSKKYSKNICVIDNIKEEEKLDLLDAGSVFSMVSTSDSFGIVYLESWYYKKPVIGAKLPVISEVISDGKDGTLVAFDDIKGISDAISRFLNNPKIRSEYGERGYMKVIKEYTWEKKCTELNKIY